jgi:hypothetical protein
MAFAQFDDNFGDHPKNAALSDAAFRLQATAILYCNKHLTDGYVPAGDVPRLVRRFRKAAVVELISAGHWSPVEMPGTGVLGYQVHDYLDWNPTRAVVLERKEKAKKRKADWQARQDGNAS